MSCSETTNVHFYNPHPRQALNKYGKTFVLEMYLGFLTSWRQSPLTHAMTACRECRSITFTHYYCHIEWSASRPVRFALREGCPDNNWIGDGVGLEAGLDVSENIKSL